MEIKKLQKKDLKKALSLVWSVFEEFEVPQYPEQGVEEFRKFISYDNIIQMFDKGEICLRGCTENDDLTGVIATKKFNHICLLFVKKEYHRKGIARSLSNAVMEDCKGRNDISEITVNSSPYAIEVYHRLGFVDKDKEQTVNGIRFTPMSYFLR